MLKKILLNIGYLAIMLSLGFAIYYYFLSPNAALKNLKTDYSTLSTQEFFAAKLPNEHGVSQSLSQYKGKIIVLNFWATWCPPCREEMPELSELHTEYKNKNVVVLGMAIDELSLVKEFSDATPVSYPLLADENEGMALASHLGNDKGVLPYTVIINIDGTVANAYFGRINKPLLASSLDKLLAH
ncbi:TlpA disulfide reductase family protein [Methylotenera sp.]|uniref:TlpA family protein disulfide reductase n=1 Tax=Methylotenera sp. TaxID=2051956 RepID=UPI00273206FE|nr:TlpA disulfide reductase family protein [Methylotenera sp.]MDP2072419.1 TlpA disulfide reductase family protein [Methylotenera sp.]MDP3005662.1 TlpA disulfide reductase family protein [Methylotenera sp.]